MKHLKCETFLIFSLPAKIFKPVRVLFNTTLLTSRYEATLYVSPPLLYSSIGCVFNPRKGVLIRSEDNSILLFLKVFL